MCLYPRLIKNRKYTITKKNGGVIPAIKDERVTTVPVKCGKCMECRKAIAREWGIRLQEEVRNNTNGKFVTLTFSNESIRNIIEGKNVNGEDIKNRNTGEIKQGINLEGHNLDNEIATQAIRAFLERWRKKYKKSIKHWLITEIGHQGTENIHMHGIIWTNESMKEIENIWKYGYVWKGKENAIGEVENYVNERTVNYLVKYVSKQDKLNKEYKPKVLTSAGIGADYTKRKDYENNKYKGEKTKETYTTRTGHKVALPVYWRNKIYTDEEKEKLWIIKLDKKERWINGQKIDISKTEEGYYKALEYARKINKRLGYGNDEIDWDRKNYENERRKLKIEQRINPS